MTDQLPPFPDVEPPNRSFWRNLSVVWLVPVLALVVALGIAWQAYSDRGTLIEIRFESAAGVTAGETTVRYRDVVIGTVEDVRFSEDLQTVIVDARIDNAVLPYLDEDARFWVVRPEISARGVSGLSTVVSGVYIEGVWNNEAGTERRTFDGLSSALFVLPGEQGRVLTLTVPDGMQLSGGAPVIYRGIEVGRLQDPVLSEDGRTVTVEVFIQAPHDQRINAATRFWDTSGFSINLGTEGLSLNVESLASLVTGGIEFDDVYDGAGPVDVDATFEVYTSEELALASAFQRPPVGDIPLSIQFNRRVRGLVVGTSVVMDGEIIGEVTGVSVRSFDTPNGASVRRMVADLMVDAKLMGLETGATAEDVYDYLDEQIADGLRARLTSSGLISSETLIEFAFDYTSGRAMLDRTSSDVPIMPWVPTPPSSLNATAEGLLERLSALPFEALMNQTIDTLASVEGLAGDPALRGVPEEAVGLLQDARNLIGGETAQAIPVQALAAVADLRAIAAELRASELSEAFNAILTSTDAVLVSADQVITSANGVVETASTIMGPLNTASAQLPTIMENLMTLSETAAALEVDALIASANSVLAGADAFLTAEGMTEVPGNLASALTELEALMTALSEADVVGSLNSTLTSAEAAANSANAAAQALPALVERTETVLEQVNGLLASYGPRSDFMGDTRSVLQDITAAARAIARLARAIERNPNSLLTGR